VRLGTAIDAKVAVHKEIEPNQLALDGLSFESAFSCSGKTLLDYGALLSIPRFPTKMNASPRTLTDPSKLRSPSV